MSNLPPNASSQERALSDTVARISNVPVRVREVWDENAIPSNLLPWLAWAYSVDDWSSNWTDQQKRQAIGRSISVHRYKGTIGAVREALAALGIEVTVSEWFEQTPAGDPYTFDIRLNVQGQPVPEAGLQRLLDVVNATKNLRSHLVTVVPGATTTNQLYCAAVSGVGLEITVQYGGGNLVADGTVLADGSERANGIRFNI